MWQYQHNQTSINLSQHPLTNPTANQFTVELKVKGRDALACAVADQLKLSVFQQALYLIADNTQVTLQIEVRRGLEYGVSLTKSSNNLSLQIPVLKQFKNNDLKQVTDIIIKRAIVMHALQLGSDFFLGTAPNEASLQILKNLTAELLNLPVEKVDKTKIRSAISDILTMERSSTNKKVGSSTNSDIQELENLRRKQVEKLQHYLSTANQAALEDWLPTAITLIANTYTISCLLNQNDKAKQLFSTSIDRLTLSVKTNFAEQLYLANRARCQEIVSFIENLEQRLRVTNFDKGLPEYLKPTPNSTNISILFRQELLAEQHHKLTEDKQPATLIENLNLPLADLATEFIAALKLDHRLRATIATRNIDFINTVEQLIISIVSLPQTIISLQQNNTDCDVELFEKLLTAVLAMPFLEDPKHKNIAIYYHDFILSNLEIPPAAVVSAPKQNMEIRNLSYLGGLILLSSWINSKIEDLPKIANTHSQQIAGIVVRSLRAALYAYEGTVITYLEKNVSNADDYATIINDDLAAIEASVPSANLLAIDVGLEGAFEAQMRLVIQHTRERVKLLELSQLPIEELLEHVKQLQLTTETGPAANIVNAAVIRLKDKISSFAHKLSSAANDTLNKLANEASAIPLVEHASTLLKIVQQNPSSEENQNIRTLVEGHLREWLKILQEGYGQDIRRVNLINNNSDTSQISEPQTEDFYRAIIAVDLLIGELRIIRDRLKPFRVLLVPPDNEQAKIKLAPIDECAALIITNTRNNVKKRLSAWPNALKQVKQKIELDLKSAHSDTRTRAKQVKSCLELLKFYT